VLAATRASAPLRPVVDGVVLREPALDAIAAGAGAGVPLIIGVTRDEASAFATEPQDLDWDGFAAVAGADAAALRARHPGRSPWWTLVAERTERMFRAPALGVAAAKAGAPVYVYEFAWETPVLGGSLGAAHGIDVAFPFDNTDVHPATAGSPTARRLAPVVSDAWVAFARSGDPNHAALPRWPAYDAEQGATLVFDVAPRVERSLAPVA
jgi:para-nitrobenzyl esterase